MVRDSDSANLLQEMIDLDIKRVKKFGGFSVASYLQNAFCCNMSIQSGTLPLVAPIARISSWPAASVPSPLCVLELSKQDLG